MELIYTEDQIEEVAFNVLGAVSENSILCFYGSMGAGKTTLIKALIRVLNSSQSGNSPTFGIVNEYVRLDGSLLGYHFDFYRIEDENEALDIGLEEYLAQDVWIFIEWPENIESLIPTDAIRIEIEVIDKQTRKLNISS